MIPRAKELGRELKAAWVKHRVRMSRSWARTAGRQNSRELQVLAGTSIH